MGFILLAAGITGAVTVSVGILPLPAGAVWSGVAMAAGAYLLSGRLAAAKWVRAVAVFSAAAGFAAPMGWMVLRPFDLTLTQFRLNPGAFGIDGAAIVIAICLSFWTMHELGRVVVRDALDQGGFRTWNDRLGVQAGIGLMLLATIIQWLPLHGTSAARAVSLAEDQMGPRYRYQLTSIKNGPGTDVTGVVTAWTHTEIQTVILHWNAR